MELRRVGENCRGLRVGNGAPRHPAAARRGLRKAGEEKPAPEPGVPVSLWASVSSSVNVSLYSEMPSVRTVGRAMGP